MGAFADYLSSADVDAANPTPVDNSPGQFKRGLRSGLSGAEAQLQALAGTAGEAVGADDFARGRYDAAHTAQLEAEANAPRVSSYRDVHGIRDTYDYVTGLLGQSVPAVGAGVAGGVAGGLAAGPAGAIGGAALATTPFEAGDIAQRQQADPQALQEGAGERLARAVGGGALSAGVQAVVPGMVGGKIVGGAVKRGLREALVSGLEHTPVTAAINAGATAGGEAIKQTATNDAAPLDTDRIGEAAVGGAAAGMGMHAIGMAGDMAHSSLPSLPTPKMPSLKGATDLAGDAAAAVADKTAGAVDAVKAADPAAKLRDLYDAGKSKAQELWSTVASGADPATLMAKAGATAEDIRSKLPEIDAQTQQTVASWAQDQLAKGGLPPERQQFLQDKLATIGDKASQQAIATFKLGQDAARDVAGKARGLLDSFAGSMKNKGEAQRSEDYSGVDARIASELMPVLQETHPGLESDPAVMNHVAEGVRTALEVFANGGREAVSSDRVAKLIDIFGDRAADVLDRVQGTLQSVPPEQRENFYSALNEVKRQQKDSDKVLGLMQRSLAPELQDSVRMPELRQELSVLRDWVANADHASEETAFKGQSVLKDMESRYGKNASKILDAVEAERAKRAKTENVLNEDDLKANGLEAQDSRQLGDTIEYGREVKTPGEQPFRTLDLHPDLDPNGDKGQATQALARAAKDNPGRTARFATAAELGDAHPGVQHTLKRLQDSFMQAGKEPDEAAAMAKKAIGNYGMAVADGKEMPGTIHRDNIKQVLVGKGKPDTPRSHFEQPSVFKVDGKAYDARALTKMMGKQFAGEYDVSDNNSALHRTGRLFSEGVAALQDHLGKPVELHDGLVVDSHGTTVGDLKKLGYAPERRTNDVLESKLQALKDRYAQRAEKITDPAKLEDLRAELREKLAEERDRAVSFDPREDILDGDPTAKEADPLNDSTALLGNKTEPVHVNSDGSGRTVADDSGGDRASTADRLKPAEVAALGKLMDTLGAKAETAAGHAIVARGQELLANADVINRSGQRALASMLQKGKRLSDIASTINALHEKYKAQFKPVAKEATLEPKAKARVSEDVKAEAAKPGTFDVDRMVDREDYSSLTDAGKTQSFLEEAARRLVELTKLGDARTDAQDVAYYRLQDLLREGVHQTDLGSFFEDFGAEGALDDKAVRARLLKSVPEVADLIRPKDGKRFSEERVDPNSNAAMLQRGEMRKYIDAVLGPQVKAAISKILHAGDYEAASDTIRVSVHALNPMGVAYHESMHALMKRLMDGGNGRVAQVLRDVAMSENVQRQMRDFFSAQPAVLKQLASPEESAAYMYQMWKQGQLTVGPAAKGIFGRIADTLRSALGIWSQSKRAEEIMRYFSSGEFKRNAGRPNEIARALIESGKNPAIERAKAFTKPLTDLAETVGSAGAERMRSTGIPALVELSNLMKATGREARDDKGFLPTAREVRTRTMNAFAAAMRDQKDAHVQDALKALQTRAAAATPEGRLIVRQVKTLLQQQLRYMEQAGVDTARILPDPDYFPRKYDAEYISRHQDEFRAVLENHGLNSNESAAVVQRLMGSNGADPLFEVNRPGMTNLKARTLGEIPDAVLEPYMVKNLWEVMDSYVSQAARRAEWARRFGDAPDSMSRFFDAARKQGASDKQIELADNFVKAVDGTLGDGLDPTMRRLMGNALVYENVRLLPMAIFSSVIDPLGIIVRGGTVGDAWTTFQRGVRDLPRAWRKNYTTDAHEQLAETLGVIDSAILAHDTSSLYMQGMAGDTAKKINDAFFRWNFMDGFNRSMRVGATQAAIKFLERHADGRASAHSTRWLSELGLTPSDLAGGVNVHSPKVRAAINQWVDGAVLRPDAADKPVWMNDPHFMLISHLKQFAFAFQETILKRVVHEAKAGNYSPAWALASYVPVMIASDMLKGMLQGGGDTPQWKRGWGPGDYMESGVERAGLYGAGQFMLDAAKDVTRGDLFPGSLTGPAIEQLKEGVMTLTGREDASTFAEHALPAHSLYMGFMDPKNAKADPTFAE